MDRSTNPLATGAAALARSADLDQTLAALLGAATNATGAVVGAVVIEDPDRPGLQLLASTGISPGDAHSRPTPTTRTTRSRWPPASCRRTFGHIVTRSDGTQIVDALLPLVVGHDGVDMGVGVLAFGWPAPHAFSDQDRETLQGLADLAAVAIDRARMSSLVAERSEWFERMAHTDPLTGLANTRTLGRVLELELARAARQGGEVSVALIDVDGLSAVNDAAGHEAGDDILRAVARVLAEIGPAGRHGRPLRRRRVRPDCPRRGRPDRRPADPRWGSGPGRTGRPPDQRVGRPGPLPDRRG